ncbi:cytochrome b5 reductase 4-like [Dorcoceras hygrometricum]|uniref:Cytochrome b5 reductase 4-like n=1 Tax=Dorcoceras hygrometricum TaxID=472368 RepID=A0A2Z7C9P0_9LAMI|nr:cytochrome b5 reductase 4-like [Dorcoceras hygrometricum]
MPPPRPAGNPHDRSPCSGHHCRSPSAKTTPRSSRSYSDRPWLKPWANHGELVAASGRSSNAALSRPPAGLRVRSPCYGHHDRIPSGWTTRRSRRSYPDQPYLKPWAIHGERTAASGCPSPAARCATHDFYCKIWFTRTLNHYPPMILTTMSPLGTSRTEQSPMEITMT